MKDCRQFYIDGKWVAPERTHDVDVINPANEETIATISLGSAGDVDKAVAAAKRSWGTFSETTAGERLALLRRIIEVYKARQDEMAETISREMGCPISLSRAAQAPAGLAHLLLVDNPPQHPAGDFVLDAQGIVRGDGANKLTFSGIGVYRQALLQNWRAVIDDAPAAGMKPPRFKLAPLLRAAMAKGQISGSHHRGTWTDVGTPQRLAQLEFEVSH